MARLSSPAATRGGFAPPSPLAAARASAAVVAVPVADVRRLPDHTSELVSQGLFGETFRVLALSRDRRWLHLRGEEDGYAGWVRSWSLALGSLASASAWRGRALGRVDLPWLDLGPARGALPFGARVARDRGMLWGPLGPLGVRAVGVAALVGPRVGVPSPRLGRAVVATAVRLTGVPYHWGGRTFAGTDCSGLVQLAARPHGLALPRDARVQCLGVGGVRRLLAFERAMLPAGQGGIRPGDLWFFGPGPGAVTHVALSTGGLGLIHAYGRVAPGSLDPGAPAFEPELFRNVLGWGRLASFLSHKRAS